MKIEKPEIIALRKAVEAAVPREIKTSYDFNYLSGAIAGRCKDMLSETTLKRVWGYVEGYDTIRQHTLQVLARFAGYESYEAFYEEFCKTRESDIVIGKSIKSEEIEVGTVLHFTWQPDRECRVQYLGENKYLILEALHTQLKPQDTFVSALFIIGEPLYLDQLVHKGKSMNTYVVGKKTGLTSIEVEI